MTGAPDPLAAAPLGHATGYPDTYDPGQLYAIARGPQRASIGLAAGAPLPFDGSDVWTAWEITWLAPSGVPAIAIATLDIPARSPSLVESKSMKLYLGSFAQTTFASPAEVAATIARDVGAAVGAPVRATLEGPEAFASQRIAELDGESIDAVAVDCTYDAIDTAALRADRGRDADEALVTDLFRSVCPVTGQPDIASVRIAYRGPRIDRAGLLRYLVSYRRHPGFHEHCVERIFVDVAARCAPRALTVLARFTRRGGIDINPWRSTASGASPPNVRTARQ